MPSPSFLGRVVELTHGASLPEILSEGLVRHESVAAIAAATGVSKRTVYRWAREHGIETPRNPGRKRKAVNEAIPAPDAS